MQVTHMILNVIQSALPNSNFDWGMVTAICAVVGLGGAMLSASIRNSVKTELQEQDKRMDAKFANKEVIEAKHQEHDKRIVVLESHFMPNVHPRGRSGD